jgi:hypothetical protein
MLNGPSDLPRLSRNSIWQTETHLSLFDVISVQFFYFYYYNARLLRHSAWNVNAQLNSKNPSSAKLCIPSQTANQPELKPRLIDWLTGNYLASAEFNACQSTE